MTSTIVIKGNIVDKNKQPCAGYFIRAWDREHKIKTSDGQLIEIRTNSEPVRTNGRGEFQLEFNESMLKKFFTSTDNREPILYFVVSRPRLSRAGGEEEHIFSTMDVFSWKLDQNKPKIQIEDRELYVSRDLGTIPINGYIITMIDFQETAEDPVDPNAGFLDNAVYARLGPQRNSCFYHSATILQNAKDTPI